MAETIAVIAMGEMGSGVARRLHERGATVITSLAGRSAASAARAEKAGAIPVSTDDELVRAGRHHPVDRAAGRCGGARRAARAGDQARRAQAGLCRLQRGLAADRGADRRGAARIPAASMWMPGSSARRRARHGRTIFYASGPGAKEFERLSAHGLTIRLMDGPNGAASAMKLSYAGITKGCTAIGSAMMLGATRGGTADALLQELSESQPMLLNWMRGFVSRMPPKAYRWVAEMEEIAQVPGGRQAARDDVSRHRAVLRADRRGAGSAEAGRRDRAAQRFLRRAGEAQVGIVIAVR